MSEKIVKKHPFFEDLVRAINSYESRKVTQEEFESLKDYVCTIYPSSLLNIKWGGWEIGLPRPDDEIPQKYVSFWRGNAVMMFKDFFNRVEKGELYCSYSVIIEKFGEGIEARIGKSSGLHYNLEAAYWTFNIKFNNWINQNIKAHNCTLICHLDAILARLDAYYLREGFFPTPGPHDIGPKKRKKLQDKMLFDVAPNIRTALMKDIWG